MKSRRDRSSDSDWSTLRLKINKWVRQCLTQRHVDLSKLAIHVHPSYVNIQGVMLKASGNHFSGADLSFLQQDLQRINGVRKIVMSLENWFYNEDRGEWINPEMERARKRKRLEGKSRY